MKGSGIISCFKNPAGTVEILLRFHLQSSLAGLEIIRDHRFQAINRLAIIKHP